MKESFSRGKEASGLAVLDDQHNLSLIKSDLDGKSLLKSTDYKQFTHALQHRMTYIAMGHSRLATHGTQLEHSNNQPVIASDKSMVVIHNGIITNTATLWEKAGKKEREPVLDTQALTEYLSFLLQNKHDASALKELYETIEGSASLAILNPKNKSLSLSTNTGSLYYVLNQEHLFFASEKPFLEKIIEKVGFSEKDILHLKPQHALLIREDGAQLVAFSANQKDTIQHNHSSATVKIEDYSSKETKSEAVKLYTVKNSLSSLRNHDFDYDKIYNLQRCTKCVLPSTTPFIDFDKEGVCNFCREHKKITYKGVDELEKIISKIRKNNGEPDCLAAFSGGRDSSYGLHYLKKELGLQPLAYTYDWGMVTDMARRNQARILGKLGVEHIVVSADITMKRKHIRQNILAWMKDPHLGMVTLFMEGDKQCEFYADRLMKKYNLPVMFFFRGNELEKDEFKTGHCGVKDADPGGVIHHLEPFKKVKLLSFYAYKYFSNPAYFNSSFFDTSLGFFTTYIQPHDYIYLWHYVKWDEKTIVDTLKNEYSWETPKETNQTWRTDDGTSAFYNYIYYMGQGFTENDSFRSRQIREGLLDRETALKLVHEENKPRYEALQWYFDMVGLDGDKVLTVVDNMKKLY